MNLLVCLNTLCILLYENYRITPPAPPDTTLISHRICTNHEGRLFWSKIAEITLKVEEWHPCTLPLLGELVRFPLNLTKKVGRRYLYISEKSEWYLEWGAGGRWGYLIVFVSYDAQSIQTYK